MVLVHEIHSYTGLEVFSCNLDLCSLGKRAALLKLAKTTKRLLPNATECYIEVNVQILNYGLNVQKRETEPSPR